MKAMNEAAGSRNVPLFQDRPHVFVYEGTFVYSYGTKSKSPYLSQLLLRYTNVRRTTIEIAVYSISATRLGMEQITN
jgi:hypothetical protein